MTRYSWIPVLIVCLLPAADAAFGQPASGSLPVVIQRRMVGLTPPDAYQYAVSLVASRQLTITAPFSGKVRTLSTRPGGKVLPQTELIAVENQRLELTHKRALAALMVAEGELRVARVGGKAESIQLGEAQVSLAQAELELTTFDKEQTSLRSPYEATVLKVYVDEGQVIQAGDPLVTIGDLTSLVCRLPVDRKAVNAGEAITLTVEDVIVVGLVQALEPVSEDQQRLRDLAVSVTMAVVAVPNSGGKLSPGQAVYPAIVPKDPVTRIPLSSVSTATDGSRVVQVLRENVVRNVPVVLHGQIGKEDLFVSGPFTEHDHVIISASVALADRTAVQPTSVRTSASTAGGPATTGGAQSVRPAATTQPRKAGAAGF